MTVGQLIELLNKLPSDHPVVVQGYEGGFDVAKPPQLIFVQDDGVRDSYFGRFSEYDEGEKIQVVVIER